MVTHFFLTQRAWKFLFSMFFLFPGLNALSVENDYYELTTLPFPKALKLEVSGMVTLPGDRLAIAIRKGEIWIAEKISTNKPIYKKFASGLHEPL